MRGDIRSDHEWYINAVHRSYMRHLTIEPWPGGGFRVTSENGVYFVHPSTQTCTCPAGQRDGRCYHVARIIYERDCASLEEVS